MKIALVHDYLCGLGGSERTFQFLCEEFTEADIYTLAYNPYTTLPYFRSRLIHTTWMDPFVRSTTSFRWSFPIATYTMQSLDFSKYDVVLSSSATSAKYITAPKGKHICYCYIPTRAIWHFDAYFGKSKKAKWLKFFLPYLRGRDFRAAERVDRFIAISQSSQSYIKQYYNRESEIIYCPVETHKFFAAKERKPHFLLVSRLEVWKKVDYAIEAFNILGLPLRVIGAGEEEKKLKAMAKSNIVFLGEVDDTVLAKEYSECRAVIFTPFIEYGLIPLEANASGACVICYGEGGVKETMIPLGNLQGEKPTAVFFLEQTAQALIDAVEAFEKASFDSNDLIKHASQWGVDSFKRQMRAKIMEIFSATQKEKIM